MKPCDPAREAALIADLCSQGGLPFQSQDLLHSRQSPELCHVLPAGRRQQRRGTDSSPGMLNHLPFDHLSSQPISQTEMQMANPGQTVKSGDGRQSNSFASGCNFWCDWHNIIRRSTSNTLRNKQGKILLID